MVIDKEIIETQAWKAWLEPDGIIRVVLQPLAVIEIAEARLLTQAYGQLTGRRQNLILMDISAIKSASKAARDYCSTPEVVEMVRAIAFITQSPTSRIIGNLVVGINKPPYPTRLFADELEAVEWLKRFTK